MCEVWRTGPAEKTGEAQRKHIVYASKPSERSEGYEGPGGKQGFDALPFTTQKK